MNRLIVFSCLYILPCFIFSQNDLIALRGQFAQAISDSVRAEVCNKIGRYYYGIGQPDSAKYHYGKFLGFAERRKDNLQLARAYANIGSACMYIPMPDSAEWHFRKVLEIGEEEEGELFQKLKCLAYVNLGINYGANRGQTAEELNYYLKGLECAEGHSFHEMVTDALWRISNVYLEQGNFEKALENARAGLAKAIEYGNEEETMEMKRMVGIIIGEKESSPEELDEGVLNLRECLGYYVSEKRQMDQAYLCLDLAGIFGKKEQRDSALFYAKKGYGLSKEIKIGQAEVNAATVYGKALIGAGNHQKALRVLREAEDAHGSYVLSTSKMAIHKLLAEAYHEAGDYKNAYAYSLAMVADMDSTNVVLNNEKVLELQAQFETEKKERENELLRKENELAKTRSNLYGIIGLLLLATVLLGAFFYDKLRKSKKQAERLNASKNQLFAVLAHDLKGPAMSFDNLAKKVSYLITTEQPERLLELAAHFEQSGNRLKYVLNNLLDWALSQKDQFVNTPEQIEMAPLIESVVEGLGYLWKPKQIEIRKNLTGGSQCVCDENAFLIIVRNLLHNAIKYSEPGGTVEVRAHASGKRAVVEIEDRGVGMEAEMAREIKAGGRVESRLGTEGEKGNALGLQTCLKLIKRNGGEIYINSKKGEGTVFKILFRAG